MPAATTPRPLERLRALATRPELWDDDGERTPAPLVVERARQILTALLPTVAEDDLRLYGSDREGITIQVQGKAARRLVDVEPDRLIGFDLKRPAAHSREYAIPSVLSAALFLASPYEPR